MLLQIKEDGTDIQFSTTTTLTEDEREYLFNSSGNYLTEVVLNNQKALTITDTNTNDLQ